MFRSIFLIFQSRCRKLHYYNSFEWSGIECLRNERLWPFYRFFIEHLSPWIYERDGKRSALFRFTHFCVLLDLGNFLAISYIPSTLTSTCNVAWGWLMSAADIFHYTKMLFSPFTLYLFWSSGRFVIETLALPISPSDRITLFSLHTNFPNNFGQFSCKR